MKIHASLFAPRNKTLRLFQGALLGIAMLLLLATLWDWKAYRLLQLELAQHAEAQNSTTHLHIQQDPNPSQQMADFQKLHFEIKELTQLAPAPHRTLEAWLFQLSQSLPEGLRLTKLEFSGAEGALKLSLEASNPTSIDIFLNRLSQEPHLRYEDLASVGNQNLYFLTLKERP